MAATHATVAAQASTTNTAGSTTTGSWVDLTVAYQAVVLARIVNGGTGPTLGCAAIVDLSPDNGTTIYLGAGGQATAGVANSAEYDYQFELPPGTMYARTRFVGNTGQSVTVQADVTKLTGI